MVQNLVSVFKLTKKERKVIKQKKTTCKFLENGSNIYHCYSRSAFLGEKRLINFFFYIIVIFLDNNIWKNAWIVTKYFQKILNKSVV